ncbi:MAG: polymer-forming cytoskeletal protein [Myxococcota bacterium]
MVTSRERFVHKTLSSSAKQRVEADVEVGNVIITGEVIGDITAKHSVSIEKPGRVKGTIVTPELCIERGVMFEGSCKMESLSNPSSSQAKVTLLPDPPKKSPS